MESRPVQVCVYGAENATPELIEKINRLNYISMKNYFNSLKVSDATKLAIIDGMLEEIRARELRQVAEK